MLVVQRSHCEDLAFSSAIRGDLLGLPKKGDYVTVRKYSTSICDTYVRLKISWGGR